LLREMKANPPTSDRAHAKKVQSDYDRLNSKQKAEYDDATSIHGGLKAAKVVGRDGVEYAREVHLEGMKAALRSARNRPANVERRLQEMFAAREAMKQA
jgi:hypothetical protein